MVDSSQFYKYASQWGKLFPKAAVALSFIEKEEKREADSPEVIENWFKELNLLNAELLYVYGVGEGHVFNAAKQWLEENKKRRLIFLEDDLASINHLFHLNIAEQILNHPQIKIIYFETLTESEVALTELYWQFTTTQIVIAISPLYARTKAVIAQELEYKILYDAALRYAVTDEYWTYGVSFFKNYYPNLFGLVGASLGNASENLFKGVPAIICGAGPSLNKHLPLLAQLKDKALIFAGGSSVNALNAANIQPHLGAGIDPNPEQYKRMSTNTAYEVPYLFRNRMYHEAFKLIRGPRLFVTGSGGFDISDFFEKEFEIEGHDIDEGFNVINFCLDIARLWGCNPIIFIGLDLAYTDKQAYASGVVDQTDVDFDKFLNNPNIEERPLVRPDIYGKPTYTLWKWLTESKWIGDFFVDHPEITLFNATEGGIGFPKVPNISFEAVIKKELNQNFDLAGRLHGEIQNHLLSQMTNERVSEALNKLKESLQRCIEHITVIYDETLKMISKTKDEEQVPKITQTGLAALSEIELSEEPGYQYLLEVFNIVYTKKLIYEVRENEESRSDWEQAIHKWTINNKKLSFLRDVAKANISMIDYSQTHN